METILFRCDAGHRIGFGHLTRCRALADALARKGKQCAIAGPSESLQTREDRNRFNHWRPLDASFDYTRDAEKVIGIATEVNARFLVLDHYQIDETYQLLIKQAGLNWLQFDHTCAKPLLGDIILNANPAVRPDDYSQVLRNSSAQLLLGPKYAILRPEFGEARECLTGHAKFVSQVIVAFGGGDDRGAILKILPILISVLDPRTRISIISGEHNPRIPAIAAWVKGQGDGRVKLFVNPPDIAELMVHSSFAVMAGGTMTYEAAACGLPMILIPIVDNQLRQSKAWADAGSAVCLGSLHDFDRDEFIRVLKDVKDTPGMREDMSRMACSLVDGRGASRVAKTIQSLQS